MAHSAVLDVRPRPSGGGQPAVDLTWTSGHDEDLDDLPDIVQVLASRLVAGLDSRPFHPTADQLAWVWGGELVRGETRQNRARIASGRYAGLFANHVVPDVTLDGAVGAYARIWLCARLAFMESAGSGESEPPGDGHVSEWENEGGSAA